MRARGMWRFVSEQRKEGRLNELALFAGAGGGVLGGCLLGWTTVCAVEIERYPRECLLQRQRDGILPPFPIWDDVCTFDGKPWRGLVDVVSGGFPCQDISAAGKGAGIDGARSGLWAEMYRIICEVRPRFAFMENSPMLTSRGLYRVLGNLAEAGYDAAWMVLGAADVGAPHVRKRIWILAQDSRRRDVFPHAELRGAGRGEQQPEGSAEAEGGGQNRVEAGGILAYAMQQWQGRQQRGKEVEEATSNASCERCEEQWRTGAAGEEVSAAGCCGWWRSEPSVGRVADGVARRVDRLKAIGNGQVPLVAATAFGHLKKTLELELSHG